jgi:hypothetical protein
MLSITAKLAIGFTCLFILLGLIIFFMWKDNKIKFKNPNYDSNFSDSPEYNTPIFGDVSGKYGYDEENEVPKLVLEKSISEPYTYYSNSRPSISYKFSHSDGETDFYVGSDGNSLQITEHNDKFHILLENEMLEN